MDGVDVAYVTDPACPWSWAAEPALRRVLSEFAGDVRITYIMGGLAREVADAGAHALAVLDASAASGMPVDPRAWLDRPPRSTHPACQAVKAAAEQHLEGPYLRVLREGFMLERAALDTADGLIAAARRVPGLDMARFEIGLRSHAIAEAFGADLERAAGAPTPTFVVTGPHGGERRLEAEWQLAPLRDAVLAAGARAGDRGGFPRPEDALRRFGRMTTAEVAAVCDLPGPRAATELWRLAGEWRVRRDRVLAGDVWALA